MVHRKRIIKAQQLLKDLNVQAVIVTSPSNFFYLSGTWLDSHERLQAIVIPQTGEPAMIVHEMSKEEVDRSGLFENYFWKDGDNPLELLVKTLPTLGAVSVDNFWPSQYLLELIKLKKGLRFIPSTNVIGALRLYKDKEEIELLKSSAEVADEVMKQVVNYIHPGITEKEVVDEIKSLFASKGAERLSFNPIVGAGKNGAIPHHQSDETVIKSGDMVVIDIGGVNNYYCSDITRTVLVECEPNEEMKKVYGVVRCAQEEAVRAIKPGVALKKIDQAARDIIKKAGYGPNFTHRIGHGLGIDVHEEPSVTHNNEQILEEGMVISIEPGIYLNGKFGVRIEDIVVVTSSGCERLNKFTRDLLIKENTI